jgi:two-component system, OmpR family, response regulator
MEVGESAQVVLIEDDPAFAEELTEFLESHGLSVHWINSLQDALGTVVRMRPDVVVLDQFVAGRDSLLLLPELRRTYSGGLLVLTGNQDVTDRILALETGADDFVAKSLGARELLARLRAVLRRARAAVTRGAESAGAAGGGAAWHIDMLRQQVRAPDGAMLRLTGAEFQALVFLAQRAGRVVLREDVSQSVLDRPFSVLDRSVDNLVSRLRKALEPHFPDEAVIRSVRGRGYVFLAMDMARGIVSGDGLLE